MFQPAPKPRCYELLIKQAADKLKITCIPNRLSILTQPLNGRPACHYCGQCGRGCATHSNFSSPSVLLPPALATGKLRIIPNAMAREVLTDDSGLATGVSYVNRTDRRDYAVRARIVVLAASACESARLLLNSKSGRFPDGLANSSGVVGRYLTDSTGLGVSGHIPKMEHGVPHNEDGAGGAHLYMPWWLDNKKLDFPRGYHIELGGGKRSAPGFGFMGGIQRFNGVGGYGKSLKDDYRRFYGATVNFAGRGEMIPNEHTYCEIDPNVVDTLRHSGAAVPRQVLGARDQPGEAHAGDLPRDHPRDGRHADVADAVARSALRPGAGRTHHPRSRHDADGQRPADVGAECELPGARCEEPVRRGRRPVRVQRAQELHVDDSRAGDADRRRHRATAKPGDPVMKNISRRAALQIVTVGAGRRRAGVDAGRGAAGARTRDDRAGAGRKDCDRRSSRSSSPRTNTRPWPCWSI